MDGKGEAWSGSEAAEKNPKSFAFPHYHSKKSQPKSFLTSPRIHTHTLAVKVLSNNNRYFLPIFLSLSFSLVYLLVFKAIIKAEEELRMKRREKIFPPPFLYASPLIAITPPNVCKRLSGNFQLCFAKKR